MKIARRRSGFTLVELIIVVALISLLSGIAVFSIQTFFDQNIRKATLADLRQLATALEFSHQDMGFFPKLSSLNDPKAVLMINQATGLPSPTNVIASLDYYGYYDSANSGAIVSRVESKWTGPYGGWSVNRARSARGGQSGLIKVRIADLMTNPNTINYAVVSWPADNYGHPYVLYQMKLVANPLGVLEPQYITGPGDEGDGFNAVVSYGPNRLPGGSLKLPDGTFKDSMRRADQFLAGDAWNQGAAFTLRGLLDINAPNVPNGGPLLGLIPTSLQAQQDLTDSISVRSVAADPANGIAGILDVGSDDLIIEF